MCAVVCRARSRVGAPAVGRPSRRRARCCAQRPGRGAPGAGGGAEGREGAPLPKRLVRRAEQDIDQLDRWQREATEEHWSQGGLRRDIFAGDVRAKRKAMEDQLRVKEAVNLHHRSIVRFQLGVVEAVQRTTNEFTRGMAKAQRERFDYEVPVAEAAQAAGQGDAGGEQAERCPDVFSNTTAGARARFERMLRETSSAAAPRRDPLDEARRRIPADTRQGAFLRNLADALKEGMSSFDEETQAAESEQDLEVPTEPEDIVVVITALASLGELDSKPGAELLVSVAALPDADAREALVAALACAAAADAPEAIGNFGCRILSTLAEDEDQTVRAAAEEAIDALRKALE